MKIHPASEDLKDFPLLPEGATGVFVTRWWCGDNTEYGCDCEQVQVVAKLPHGHPQRIALLNEQLQIWEGTYTSADRDEYLDDAGKNYDRSDVIKAEYEAACKHYGYKADEK